MERKWDRENIRQKAWRRQNNFISVYCKGNAYWYQNIPIIEFWMIIQKCKHDFVPTWINQIFTYLSVLSTHREFTAFLDRILIFSFKNKCCCLAVKVTLKELLRFQNTNLPDSELYFLWKELDTPNASFCWGLCTPLANKSILSLSTDIWFNHTQKNMWPELEE